MTRTIETVFDDQTLRVRRMQGVSDTLVVAFSGIGHREGLAQREEFAGTASAGGVNSVLFVLDKKRSWFSTAGLASKVVSCVRQETDRLGSRKVITVGNSMGAYGVLLLSGRIGAHTAIAFSPQFSMNDTVVREERWRKFRRFFDPELAESVTDHFSDDVEYYVFFGADEARDMVHARQFPDRPNLHVYSILDGGHQVAGRLKDLGVLGPVVSSAFRNDTAAIEALLSDAVLQR